MVNVKAKVKALFIKRHLMWFKNFFDNLNYTSAKFTANIN